MLGEWLAPLQEWLGLSSLLELLVLAVLIVLIIKVVKGE